MSTKKMEQRLYPVFKRAVPFLSPARLGPVENRGKAVVFLVFSLFFIKAGPLI